MANKYDRELDERYESEFDREHFKRMLGYLKPHRRMVIIVLALMITVASTNLAGPFLLKIAIDKYIKYKNFLGLSGIVGIYIIVQLANWRCNYWRQYLMSRMGAEDTVRHASATL